MKPECKKIFCSNSFVPTKRGASTRRSTIRYIAIFCWAGIADRFWFWTSNVQFWFLLIQGGLDVRFYGPQAGPFFCGLRGLDFKEQPWLMKADSWAVHRCAVLEMQICIKESSSVNCPYYYQARAIFKFHKIRQISQNQSLSLRLFWNEQPMSRMKSTVVVVTCSRQNGGWAWRGYVELRRGSDHTSASGTTFGRRHARNVRGFTWSLTRPAVTSCRSMNGTLANMTFFLLSIKWSN